MKMEEELDVQAWGTVSAKDLRQGRAWCILIVGRWRGVEFATPKYASLAKNYLELVIKDIADLGKALKTQKLPFCKRHLYL